MTPILLKLQKQPTFAFIKTNIIFKWSLYIEEERAGGKQLNCCPGHHHHHLSETVRAALRQTTMKFYEKANYNTFYGTHFSPNELCGRPPSDCLKNGEPQNPLLCV